MQQLPDWLYGFVSQAAEQHRDSIDQAVECAERAIVTHPDFPAYQAALVRNAIREQIHQKRHSDNVAIRSAAGDYGGPAKVGMTTGAANRVAQQVLDTYTICGRVLGNITGKELLDFATIEQEKADGALFNARLCRELAKLVHADKPVRQCVTEQKVRKLIDQLRGNGSKPKRRVVEQVA